MRGVNKLVVEIKPEDECFEKALLFIRPDKQSMSQTELSRNADRFFSDINKKGSGTGRFDSFLLILSGVAAGSAVSWAIVYILSII